MKSPPPLGAIGSYLPPCSRRSAHRGSLKDKVYHISFVRFCEHSFSIFFFLFSVCPCHRQPLNTMDDDFVRAVNKFNANLGIHKKSSVRDLSEKKEKKEKVDEEDANKLKEDLELHYIHNSNNKICQKFLTLPLSAKPDRLNSHSDKVILVSGPATSAVANCANATSGAATRGATALALAHREHPRVRSPHFRRAHP